MTRKYIWLGLIIGLYHPYSISMELEHEEKNCFAEEKLPLLAPQKSNKRKNPDELEWKVQSIVQSNEEKTSNGESKLKVILVRKTPLHFHNLNKKNGTLTTKQERFLKKFKTKELPSILTSQEKEILESLAYYSLFTLKETNKGWEINENTTYRGRMKIISWP